MTGYMSKRNQTETLSTKVTIDEWKMSKTSNVNLTWQLKLWLSLKLVHSQSRSNDPKNWYQIPQITTLRVKPNGKVSL